MKFSTMINTGPLLMVLLLAQAPKAPAQESPIWNLFSAPFEKLSSVEFEMVRRGFYDEGFLAWRNSTKFPLDPRGSKPSIRAHKYISNGPLFAYDCLSRSEDGAILISEKGAWDGSNWQRLKRLGGRNRLEIARKRQGVYELMSSNAMPYQEAFTFLMAPTPIPGTSPFPDSYKWVVTLESLRNPEVWKSALARVRGEIEAADYKGQACWVFVVDGGVGLGDRKTPLFHKVWLPIAHPSFPVRVESRSVPKNTAWIEFEVLEFSDPVLLEEGVSIRYPLKYRRTYLNAPGRNRNLPFRTEEIEIRKARFNLPLSKEAFCIDASEAIQVKNLDTGRIIRLK
ncbi:MAG: hypothetical protein P1V20_31435 [Verrucomicrobiales bacterium]|nr:hypothetical protein [Verrucomicrobiales bacterium]